MIIAQIVNNSANSVHSDIRSSFGARIRGVSNDQQNASHALDKIDSDYKVLYRQKWEYFLGKMDDAERLELEWPPRPLKILSGNVHIYIEGDAAIQNLLKRKAYLEEILKFVEDVIKSVNTRNFVIKSAIDFLRFKNGL